MTGESSDERTPPEADRRTVSTHPLPPAKALARRSLKPAFLGLPDPVNRIRKQGDNRFDSYSHSMIACSILGHTDRTSVQVEEVTRHVRSLGSFLRFIPPMGTIATLLLRRATEDHKDVHLPAFNPRLIDCADVEVVLLCMVVSYKLTCDETIMLKWLTLDTERWLQIEVFLLRFVTFSMVDLAFTAMDEHAFRDALERGGPVAPSRSSTPLAYVDPERRKSRSEASHLDEVGRRQA